MELIKQDQAIPAPVNGFAGLSMPRQIGLILGFAASIALAVAVVLWSQSPSLSMLYGNLSGKDLAAVTDMLDKAMIPYEINHGSGAVMVPAAKVAEARIKLATAGLPNSSEFGIDLLQKEPALGTSRFMEKARYHHVLESELAKSISALQGVESARVHLAIPKQSVFVRDQEKVAASVLLTLYAGRSLSEDQVAGIVHLVAGSIPGLEADQVTVVDQKGRMLSTNARNPALAQSSMQFEVISKLEDQYEARILDMLTPIVGAEGVRAQVVADMDFTQTEETRENYEPEQRVVRSEQLSEEVNGGAGPAGVPGALSNQPPKTGTTDPNKAQTAQMQQSSSTQSTRNYEVDRVISHSKKIPGQLQRVSVAVLVDYRSQSNAEGKVERVPLSAEEMDRITALVKEAVGFSEQRKDTLSVLNSSFQPTSVEEIVDVPIWEQPWVWDLAKQALGILFVLVLMFGVLKPTMHKLAHKELPAPAETEENQAKALAAPGAEGEEGELAEDQLSLSSDTQGVHLLPGEDPLAQAKRLVQEDPKLVAQVMKTWVHADA